MALKKHELMKGDLRTVLSIALSTLRARLFKETFFTISFTMTLIDIVVSFFSYYYVSVFVKGALNPYLARYGGTYAEFLLTGMTAGVIVSFLVEAFYEAINGGYWMSETDLYVTSPVGLRGMILGQFLHSALFTGMILAVYAVGGAFLGIPLHLENVPKALIILPICILPFIGLGLIGASTFTLFDAKQGNMVSWLTYILQSLFSGYYFPVALLPWYASIIPLALPHTYLFDAFRLVMMEGLEPFSPLVIANIEALAISSIILLPLGLYLFRKSLIKAEIVGSLSRWT